MHADVAHCVDQAIIWWWWSLINEILMFLMIKPVCRVSDEVQTWKLSLEQEGSKFQCGSEKPVKDQNTKQGHPVWALGEKCPALQKSSEYCTIFCDYHLLFCTSSEGHTCGHQQRCRDEESQTFSLFSYEIVPYFLPGQTPVVLLPGEPSSPVFIQIQVVYRWPGLRRLRPFP